MQKQIKISEVYDLIDKSKNKFQFVTFTKRTTGELRHMVYRVLGSDDRSGVPAPASRIINDIKKETITVWDLNKDTYRRINLREVTRLVIDQTEYEVVEV